MYIVYNIGVRYEHKCIIKLAYYIIPYHETSVNKRGADADEIKTKPDNNTHNKHKRQGEYNHE